jgi:CHAD domain-containing protein
MPFHFKEGESVTRGVRRVAREQLRKVLDGVLSGTGGDNDEAVHDARKRFKKLRALLKLARPGLGEKSYQRDNAAFRDTARPLSEVRDARALGEALDKLADHFKGDVPAEVVAAAREGLRRRREEVRRRVLVEQAALGDTGAAVKAARPRVKSWPPVRWADVIRGLKRSYRSAYDARAVAHGDPSDENLHEWRKRVKDLWHQLEILTPLRPQVLGPLAEQAHALADHLGDDHDLVVLAEVLPLITDRPEEAAALLPFIGRRRQELREEAYRVGEQVFREPSGDFARRVRAYRKAWRAEAKAGQFQ